MWCFSCFKPSTTVDTFEAEIDIAKAVSRHEAEIQEAEQLSLAIQESARLCQQEKEEEKRRKQELDKDAQIANGFLYEERERQINNKSALEDEKDEELAKTVEESLKEKAKSKQFEEQVKKDEQLALAVQESLNMEESPPRIAEHKRISRRAPLDVDKQLTKAVKESLKEKGKNKQFQEQLKKDEQLALAVQESLNMVESPPRIAEHKRISRRAPLDVDKQLAKAVEKSLKEKGKRKQFEEQVKKDEQLALIVQESLNMEESPPRIAEHKSISRRAPLDVDKQLAKAVEESLKEKGKRKQFEDEQVKKDGHLAESLNTVESPPRLEENNIPTRAPLDEDEQRFIWESLKGKGQIKQSIDEVEEDGKLIEVNPPRSMCCGCNAEIVDGRSVNVSGVLWHPECFCCGACHKPIATHEVKDHVSNSRGMFHKACYRYCYVCKEKIKTFNQHPFWKDKYCCAHESDGTPKCCSCERLEPRGTNYVMLDDGRWLCLECMESAVMDTYQAQSLQFEIRELFEGLNMKIQKEFPFLLVEKQALNKAEKEEKIDNQYGMVTRGICLSEEQIVTSVSKGPKMGPNKQLIGMARESQRVVSECEVTAILILYGLPRCLTGYILAHEMMHAYLRLNGHRNLNNVLEEGICQVLGHLWLESQTYSTVDAAAASSSSRSPEANSSKKGDWSEFEKELVEFCKNQIETDESPVYGVGFRKVNHMVTNSSLQETLKEILRRG